MKTLTPTLSPREREEEFVGFWIRFVCVHSHGRIIACGRSRLKRVGGFWGWEGAQMWLLGGDCARMWLFEVHDHAGVEDSIYMAFSYPS